MEKKLDFLTRNPSFSLLIMGLIGLFVRLYYFPYSVPLVLDALNEYFFYASDVSVLGHLPTNFPVDNNGWPIFLSIFFTIFRFDNALDYMTLQRAISISLSVLTIIPVYFLCSRFFERRYAIFGTSIFAFEPHLIQNSLLGLSEPLYIFLASLTLVLFFASDRKLNYISFGIAALSSVVRAEGLFLFLPILTMFFVRYRKEKKIILKSLLAVSIFILLLLPIVVLRIQISGHDAIISRISSGMSHLSVSTSQASQGSSKSVSLLTATENFVKFTGWSLIPAFILFVPAGAILIFKNREYWASAVIVIIIFMFLPVFYGFAVAPDTRYIYPLFPLFSILSVLMIKRISTRFESKNLFLILIIGGVLLSSGIFLDIKKYDYEHQREAFNVAKYVVSVAKGVNDYYPEQSYIGPAEIPSKWPVLSSSIPIETNLISSEKNQSLETYLARSKNEGLTHLVIDESKNRPEFLRDVFNHEEKYPYLVKVFDSSEHGYKYHVKIYKIDYQKLQAAITKNG